MPSHAVDRVLERLGDEHLDLLGREPGRLGLDGDLRWGELGEDVERAFADDAGAVDHQREREADRRTPRCRIELPDEPGQHARTPGSLARLVAHGDPGAELLGQQLLGAASRRRCRPARAARRRSSRRAPDDRCATRTRSNRPAPRAHDRPRRGRPTAPRRGRARHARRSPGRRRDASRTRPPACRASRRARRARAR